MWHYGLNSTRTYPVAVLTIGLSVIYFLIFHFFKSLMSVAAVAF